MSDLAIIPTPQPSLDALIAPVVAVFPSEHSRRAYASALRRFLLWCDERHLPFTRESVRAYVGHLQGIGASPATINLSLAAIKALAREAQACDAIQDVTATAIIQLRGVARQQRRCGRWLTQADAKRLADAPDNARDRALLALLLGTGLRRAEVPGLTVAQVQQLGGRICLVDVVRKRGRRQVVPLAQWVTKRLAEWLSSRPGENAGIGTSGLIFALSASGIFYLVQKWARIAGVQVSPHDLRRTASTIALNNGADIRSIQVMLGHSSVQTTEKYLKQALDLKDPACDRINL